MTSVGIRRRDLRAVVPPAVAPARTIARPARPWSRWLAAAAVAAPGGGLAIRLTESEVEHASTQSAGAVGSP